MTFPFSKCEDCESLINNGLDGYCEKHSPKDEILTRYEFDIDELRILYNLIKYQYISSDNPNNHKVVNRLCQIVYSFDDMDK